MLRNQLYPNISQHRLVTALEFNPHTHMLLWAEQRRWNEIMQFLNANPHYVRFYIDLRISFYNSWLTPLTLFEHAFAQTQYDALMYLKNAYQKYGVTARCENESIIHYVITTFNTGYIKFAVDNLFLYLPQVLSNNKKVSDLVSSRLKHIFDSPSPTNTNSTATKATHSTAIEAARSLIKLSNSTSSSSNDGLSPLLNYQPTLFFALKREEDDDEVTLYADFGTDLSKVLPKSGHLMEKFINRK